MFHGIHYRFSLSFGYDTNVFTMAVAFFVIHGNDPFATKELAFVYLVVFILMYIIGPGKFAVDRWIRKALFQKARK